MAVKKILFDIPTEHGNVRPDFRIALLDERTGQELKLSLQVLQSDDTKYLDLRAIEAERLAEIGPVLSIPVDAIDAGSFSRRILDMLD